MVKPIDTQSIARSTGRPWEEWLSWLERKSAKSMPHAQIARIVMEEGNVDGWWAQSITVAYEQAIGRRKPGQLADGSFNASVSRVVPGDPARLHAEWMAASSKLRAVAGADVDGGPTGSITPKRRYWRASFSDGSRVTMAFEKKAPGKTLVSVEHSKLASARHIEDVKEAWRELLIDCVGVD